MQLVVGCLCTNNSMLVPVDNPFIPRLLSFLLADVRSTPRTCSISLPVPEIRYS